MLFIQFLKSSKVFKLWVILEDLQKAMSRLPTYFLTLQHFMLLWCSGQSSPSTAKTTPNPCLQASNLHGF